MENKVSLKAKLIFMSLMLSLGLLAVGGIAYFGLSKTIAHYTHIVEINFANFQKLTEIRDQQRQVALAVGELVGTKNTHDEALKVEEAIHRAIADRERYIKEYESIPFVDGEEALYKKLQEGWKPFQEMSTRIVNLSKTGKSTDFAERDRLANTEYLASRKATLATQKELMAFQDRETEAWVAKAKTTAQQVTTMLTITIAAGFVLALLFGLILANSLSKTLGDVARQLSEGAGQVASAANQISSTSQTLSSAATEQASSIEETAASLQQLGGMVERNQNNAEQGVKLTEVGKGSADRGVAAMERMIESMKAILESNKKIESLVKVVEEIGEKTAVIDEIVFQTKLLSFNASVEAERAGEHGRGFAVVAQEVGNLAQMSGKAASEISTIVKTSVKDAHEIASENKERVETGYSVLQNTAQLLGEIRTNCDSLMAGSTQIVGASREQTNGIRQINKAMDVLNQTTQQTASHSEEAASAAEELTAQAGALNKIVGKLNNVVYGGTKANDEATSSSGVVAPGKVASLDAKRKEKTTPARRPTVSPLARRVVGGSGHEAELGSELEAGSADEAWEKL